MTLIVGIARDDGIVVAADGAATLGSFGNSTVVQPVRKLSALHDQIIVGVSGPVGLGQRFIAEIDKAYQNKEFVSMKPEEAMVRVSQHLRNHIMPELQAAHAAQQAIGNTALASALSSSVVAMIIEHKPVLFNFDQQGAPELASNDNMPFVAVGSGQPIADPFLAFIRRVFWDEDGPLSLQNAEFSAIWTLRHAISVTPGGVSDPIQVMRLSKEGKNWSVHELTQDEIDEHEEAVKALEQELGDKLRLDGCDKKTIKIPTP